MQGYMFGHVETWSRKGVATQNGSERTVRRNGQRGWTAEQIIDEAERLGDASPHVGRHARKPLVWPGTCSSFAELRKAHSEACAVKVAFPYTDKKTGKKRVRRRAVREDTHTLYTSVMSLPILAEDALADAATMSACLRALRLARNFEKRRLQAAGGEFAMAALHFDEPHVHIHIYGLDRQRGSVNALHPGKAALDAFRERHGALSRTGTTLFQQSKREYCEAMRGWQNDLHCEAFSKAGLMRFGPRRSRYTRAEYLRRQREEEERAAAAQELRGTRRLRESVAQIGALFDEREEMNVAKEAELDRSRKEVAALSAAVEERAEQVRNEAVEIAASARRNAQQSDAAAARAEAVEKREAEAAERAAAAETAAREADALRAANERKERELDASLATVEAIADGLLQEQEEEGGTRRWTAARTVGQHPAWQELRKRMARAPKAAGRIGTRLSGSMKAIRQKAAEQAAVEARNALAAEFAIVRKAAASLGAVHAFARKIIGRLPTGAEQSMATEELESATMAAARDLSVAERKGTGGMSPKHELET